MRVRIEIGSEISDCSGDDCLRGCVKSIAEISQPLKVRSENRVSREGDQWGDLGVDGWIIL